MIILRRTFYFILVSTLFLFNNCSKSEEKESLFELLHPDHTNVDFQNILTFRPDFNIYNYRNFYDGGGVAVGDLSGNGLPDIFLTSNFGDNQLFFNLGNYQFEDVTDQAGVAGSKKWSTGVSLADINGNGLLDIYVTNSGELDDRRNELFINNGDGTFTEAAAEFGLDDPGYSIHATFFDYNGDGHLDLYLINNADEAIGNFDLSNNLRTTRDYDGGDRLFRNNGEGSFTDVTEEAGLYSSIIGFALSAVVSDVNRNGLPDLFIANDFFERDYLYINQGDGTFSEVITNDVIRSMSAASMGADIADLNNNGWPDIYVLDMLPEPDDRIKLVTIFESYERYREKVKWDYGHQFTRNVLHLNQGGDYFKEVSRLATVQATDWSWAVLLADFDLNGYNDIYVTNGLAQDITNVDYLEEVSGEETMRAIITENVVDFKRLIDLIPSTPIRNHMFHNEGDLHFTDQTVEWGLGEPGFSSGAAWADLNGDGSLDLIINNVNGPAKIYRNRASELYPQRSWLRVDLKGEAPNTQGIGAQLQVWSDGVLRYREHFLQRGFQSSVEPGLHVGLGESTRVDSLVLRWPDGRTSRLNDLDVPARITLDQSQATHQPAPTPAPATMAGDLPVMASDQAGAPERLLTQSELPGLSGWRHLGFEYNDFTRERLLMRMRSTEGPALCSGDITGNGLQDLYTGGARGQGGTLWLQQTGGGFIAHQQDLFDRDAASEDIDCRFFDATGNGVDDLYVVSGGNSFSSSSSALIDRFYLNDGSGQMSKSDQILPGRVGFHVGSVVAAHDFTGDGNQDLFVGTRLRPFGVGLPVNGYLLAGDGRGGFEEVTAQWAPQMDGMGMITDALWADLTGDGSKELVVVGEWMPIRVFANRGERFEEITDKLGLSGTTGWWNAIAAGDLNGNGRIDLIGANHGHNSMFRASGEAPVKMWVGDLSRNGITEQILSYPKDGVNYPVALRHDLIEEIPALREKYPDYASYAGQSVEQIFTEQELSSALELSAELLGSVVVWNRPDGMHVEELPQRAQLAPMYGIALIDVTGNGLPEIIMGGNLYDVKPQSGPYDASRGVILTYEDGQLHSLNPAQSGLNIQGEIRKILPVTSLTDNIHLVFTRYNQSPAVLRSIR